MDPSPLLLSRKPTDQFLAELADCYCLYFLSIEHMTLWALPSQLAREFNCARSVDR
jgi:hypothetical protein